MPNAQLAPPTHVQRVDARTPLSILLAIVGSIEEDEEEQ
jgi:hypothetical protein